MSKKRQTHQIKSIMLEKLLLLINHITARGLKHTLEYEYSRHSKESQHGSIKTPHDLPIRISHAMDSNFQ